MYSLYKSYVQNMMPQSTLCIRSIVRPSANSRRCPLHFVSFVLILIAVIKYASEGATAVWVVKRDMQHLNGFGELSPRMISA